MNEDIHKALLAMGFYRGSERTPTSEACFHHHTLSLMLSLPLKATWPDVANALIGGGVQIQKNETKELISAALRKLGFKF
jgi:hypothetical protein